jgi:outer membrane receptor protein involved in Fe transport
MKTKTLFKRVILMSAMLLLNIIHAQTTINGSVVDEETNQPLPGVNIVVKGTYTGVSADFDGNFSITTEEEFPITLEVSYLGFGTKTIEVTSADAALNISLAPGSDALDEIVISASRTPERIFESPVPVEKYSLKKIEASTSADFFNGLGNLRSVNMTESGLVFNQVSIRGFSDVYMEGLVTLVDGMNNQAPVFGFAFGNMIGLHQLDVQSVELLPGASSALYGADAYKGTIFINSKNPFDHEGISVMYRTGVTEQDVAGSNSFTDIGVRLAKKLSDKWAIKATIAHKEGTDWTPGDYRHYNADRSINTNANYKTQFSNYDGVNTEGERTFTTSTIFDALADLAGNPALAGFSDLSPNYFDPITSPGYKIADLYGTDTYNTKGNFAIHYRPNSVTEISLQSLVGTGKAMLPTGGMMYNIDKVVVQQHKLDYKRGGLKARAYYTHEDAGDTVAGLLLGTAVANSMPGGLLDGYGTPYLQTYLGTLAASKGYPVGLPGIGALLGDIGNQIMGTVMMGGDPTPLKFNDLFGGSTALAHNNARAVADPLLLQPGTAAFNNAVDAATRSTADNLGVGARIQDISKVYNYEVDYDFGDKFSFGNVIVGAQFKNFDLNTGGTLYTDEDGPIKYSQYGAYAQLKTDLFDEFISLTTSMRYDKVEVLDVGNVTPKLALLFNLSENKNIRFSAQQGFRNPTNQDMFIGYNTSSAVILGGTQSNIDRFSKTVLLENGSPYTYTGKYVIENAVDINSLADATNGLGNVKAEVVTSYEVGYRYNTPKFTIDISAYMSKYVDKIAGKFVFVPVMTSAFNTPAAAVGADSYYTFQVDSNFNDEFETSGVNIETTFSLSNNLSANLIYEYNKTDYVAKPTDSYIIAWNTPENRIKAGLNYSSGKLSLGANARYNSEYFYQSSYVNGTIEANTIIDAKLSYDLPSLKSILEIGGNNIGGDNYVSIPGAGLIGSIYYAGLRINL